MISKRRVTFQTQATGEVFRTEHVYPPAVGETSPRTLYYTLNEKRRQQKLMHKEIAACTYIDTSFAKSVEALFLTNECENSEDIQVLAISITQHSCRGLERRVSGLFDRQRDCNCFAYNHDFPKKTHRRRYRVSCCPISVSSLAKRHDYLHSELQSVMLHNVNTTHQVTQEPRDSLCMQETLS